MSDTPIDALIAPEKDGDVLIWPNDVPLSRLAEQNRESLSRSEAMVLDRPLGEWRMAACGDAPVILAGHQPEFIHPGVWAKHVAVVGLARRVGGAAKYLLVDSDVPGRFVLAWPEVAEGRLRRAWASPFSGAASMAFERFPRQSSGEWRAFFERVAIEPGTVAPKFVEAFVDEDVRQGGDYVERWIRGVGAVEEFVGAKSPSFVRVSSVFGLCEASGAGALAFTAHLILNARSFAAAYNGALGQYRVRRGIRGNQHPIPDLQVSGNGVELPFWVSCADRPRRRLFVSSTGSDRVELLAGDEPITSFETVDLRRDSALVAQSLPSQLEIRPRALALTLYARLFASDLFIHGIGGAKYDQISDEIIRGFFGIEPPAFACVTATLRLPLQVHPVTHRDVADVRRRLRDVRYNPQRFAGDTTNDGLTKLLELRRSAIQDAERLRTTTPSDHPARRRAYARIHEVNGELLAVLPTLEPGLRDEAARLEECFEHNAVSLSREWFFALQPRSRLQGLVERVESMIR